MKETSIIFSKDSSLNKDFLMFAINNHILRFGKFKTKAGRVSPYFFDMGKFSNSRLLFFLGEFYSKALTKAENEGMERVDCLFGPAYKGIPIICATAISLNNRSRLIDFAYNRKEEKKHGEGGKIVGNISGKKVLIIDDVISAGLSISKSIEIIRREGGYPIGALVALDRMETAPATSAKSNLNASKEITLKTGVPILAISNINNLLEILNKNKSNEKKSQLKMLKTYLERWGGDN